MICSPTGFGAEVFKLVNSAKNWAALATTLGLVEDVEGARGDKEAKRRKMA